jgi:hypothetical protein
VWRSRFRTIPGTSTPSLSVYATHPKGLSSMRLVNDVTSAMGTADLFTVFWTKSAMVGYSSLARVPGNMTDDYRVGGGGD